MGDEYLGENPKFGCWRDTHLRVTGTAVSAIQQRLLTDVLKIAARSGLDGRLMIPDKPDHSLVYPATVSYADELAQAGARTSIYRNGFLHAKTVLVDHEMGSVGTANMEYRSFRLNFEVNAFFYDADLGGRLRDVYLDDLTLCSPFERSKAFGNRYAWAVKEGVSRLVSPLL